MRASLLLAVLLAAGCSHTHGPAGNIPGAVAPGRVTGIVTYSAKIALPSTAVIEVSLADVGRTDIPATVLATREIRVEDKTPPFPFELSYDPAKIVPQGSYEVSAKVKEGDKVTWVSVGKYPVITRDAAATVEIHLVQMTEP